MTRPRFLTHNDRAYRREKVALAAANGAHPRELAETFGLSLWYARDVARNGGGYSGQGRA